jgi:formate-dependent nitrite reductase membrane component NrfD
MSDTFFTAAPHWTWWIILYFFIGGMAGSAFFLASLLDWGRAQAPDTSSQSRVESRESRVGELTSDRLTARPIVRLGYYLAFIGVLISGFLLTVDLTRPLRFWHMLIENHTGRPMFKLWEPMSTGAWALLLFGLFSFLAALAALAEDRPNIRLLQSAPVRFLRRRGPSLVIAVLGSVFGLFIAGYTGVLLAVTNRPVWADSHLLGLLFLVSGASSGASALVLLAVRRRVAEPGTVGWLVWFDCNVLRLELLVLIAFLISLGSVVRVYLSWWGVVLLLGVVGLGIVLPLLEERRATHTPWQVARTASLVLLGGFLLRMVVLLSSDQIHVIGAGVTGR